MSAFTYLGRRAGQALRSVTLAPCSMQLGSTRTFVYHRSSKTPRKHASEYDDGYHYRNGEVQYAQTLLNKQEATLRFDKFLHRFQRQHHKTSNNWINYPNCQCLHELKEIEKKKPPKPRPETACALHEYSASYYDM